jgi:hypothetical protein
MAWRAWQEGEGGAVDSIIGEWKEDEKEPGYKAGHLYAEGRRKRKKKEMR